MANVLQANKKTTVSGTFAAGATSLTLATAAFTNFTDGYLVVDYDNDSKFEVIKCTVTGTAVTSITRGQDGTSDVAHSSGAKIGFMFIPSHYGDLGKISASDGWTAFVPTYAATGSMTYTSVTTSYAAYIKLGKIVIFQMSATGTTGGTASNGITFTFPVSIATAPANQGSVFAGFTDSIAAFAFPTAATTIEVRRYDNSNYPLGAGRSIQVGGVVESAS